MLVTFDSVEYQVVRGSDVQRDGMYLEMNDTSGASPETVLFSFYSDATGRMTFSAYREDLPLEAVEWFLAQSRWQLPPTKGAPPEGESER